MTNPLIVLNDLSKSYSLGEEEYPILKKINLTINPGELVAILGASGSGKSTLMNILGLLDSPTQGEYFLHNQKVALLDQDALATLRNRHIGFIFQQFNLLPRFTAAQNIALPLTYRESSTVEINQTVEKMLRRVNMSNYGQRKPTQLSGGQQQRIAIARALVTQPEILLADEPTGALDSQTGKEIMNLFLNLHEEGRTVIIITHDENIAKQCSRRLLIKDGQIIGEQHS